MPLVTRDPYKQVSQGKEMLGCYSIPSLQIVSPAFLDAGTRQIKLMVSQPCPFLIIPCLALAKNRSKGVI